MDCSKTNCPKLQKEYEKVRKELDEYQKKPTEMHPFRYSQMYSDLIRAKVEYQICCTGKPAIAFSPK